MSAVQNPVFRCFVGTAACLTCLSWTQANMSVGLIGDGLGVQSDSLKRTISRLISKSSSILDDAGL